MTKSHPPADQPTFHLTKIKKQVLALIAEYFCLRTNDLVDLVYGKQTEPSRASMRRTLSLLLKEGFLHRLPYIEAERTKGASTFVYGLTDQGCALYGDLAGPRAKTFDDHSQRTLDHELEISFFHIALKNLCERHTNLRLFWQQRDLKCTINPDAYFAITDTSKPEGKDTLHYFLEIERAKLGSWKNGEPQIIRKIAKYYAYYNSDTCQKEWKHFRQFRVILVQRTEQKREFLLSKLGEYKHRMFWLTTEDLYKAEMGGKIFKTPKDFTDATYFLLPRI
jgi:hypothetical protein